MKRLIVLVLAIVCGVSYSEGFAKKPKKSTSENTNSMQLEDMMYRNPNQAKLDSLRIEKERLDSLMELELLEALLEQQKPRMRGPLGPYEEIELLDPPCQEEAKSTDEYYGAWAVSAEQPNQNYAIQDAVMRAQRELSRQIGEDEATIDKAEIVCRTISRDSRGNYIAYVAIRMPKNK